jgi:Ion channel
VEGRAFIIPAHMVLFAAFYHVVNHANAASFGTRMTKRDSLYFSATIFTTVEFGDHRQDPGGPGACPVPDGLGTGAQLESS